MCTTQEGIVTPVCLPNIHSLLHLSNIILNSFMFPPSAPRVDPDYRKLLSIWGRTDQTKGEDILQAGRNRSHSAYRLNWLPLISGRKPGSKYQLCEEQGRGRERNWICDEVIKLLNQIILESTILYFLLYILLWFFSSKFKSGYIKCYLCSQKHPN